MREWFEGFGERARAFTKAAMVFAGISLLGAIIVTHGLLSTANGFASVLWLIVLIAMVNTAMTAARRAYARAMGVDDDEAE